MFGLLKSEIFGPSAMSLLRRGKASEEDFDVFVDLDNLLNQYRIEKASKK